MDWMYFGAYRNAENKKRRFATNLFPARAQEARKLKPSNPAISTGYPGYQPRVRLESALGKQRARPDALASRGGDDGSLDCSPRGVPACMLIPPTPLPVGILEQLSVWYHYPWQVRFPRGERVLASPTLRRVCSSSRVCVRAATTEGSFGSPPDGSRHSQGARWRLGAGVGFRALQWY